MDFMEKSHVKVMAPPRSFPAVALKCVDPPILGAEHEGEQRGCVHKVNELRPDTQEVGQNNYNPVSDHPESHESVDVVEL